MSKKNKNSNVEDLEVDPLEELEFDDDFTSIETEKDFFDELELSNLEEVPKYDSKSGKIIEGSDEASQAKKSKAKTVKNKIDLMDTIDKVDVNNNIQKPIDLDEVTLPKNEIDNVKSTKNTKKGSLKPNKNKEKTLAEDTKVIDNVKVDSNGVPLLNQFDTKKIKEANIIPKFTIKRISISKVITILLGAIITLIGILQAMNDVVKISDHVMYGEHESMAMGLILLGLIIIVLAFYKEIVNLTGINNITNEFDSTDSMPKRNNHEKSDKK